MIRAQYNAPGFKVLNQCNGMEGKTYKLHYNTNQIGNLVHLHGEGEWQKLSACNTMQSFKV